MGARVGFELFVRAGSIGSTVRRKMVWVLGIRSSEGEHVGGFATTTTTQQHKNAPIGFSKSIATITWRQFKMLRSLEPMSLIHPSFPPIPLLISQTQKLVSSPSHRIKRPNMVKRMYNEDHQKLRQRSTRRQFDDSCLRDVQCRA